MSIIKRLSTPEFDQHQNELRAIYKQWIKDGMNYNQHTWDEFRDLICGATTRKGIPCKQTALYSNGRCKFHGGLSCGPKTKKGKQASTSNLQRWRENRK